MNKDLIEEGKNAITEALLSGKGIQEIFSAASDYIPNPILLSDGSFRVVASVNTRLREGDTFQANMIVEGEPLYIDNLRQADRQPIAYVCGKISGVMFERL